MKQNLADRFKAVGGELHPDHRGTIAVAFHSTTAALHAFAGVGGAIVWTARGTASREVLLETNEEWEALLATRIDMIDGDLVLVV